MVGAQGQALEQPLEGRELALGQGLLAGLGGGFGGHVDGDAAHLVDVRDLGARGRAAQR